MYDILVVPMLRAAKTPVLVPIVPAKVLLLLQLPPVVLQVNVVVWPWHTSVTPEIDAESGFTLTCTVAAFEQPLALVPTTVYMVVADGEAEGLAHAVQERELPGVQAYVPAPEAVSVVLLPSQIVTFEPALTVGSAFTDTVTVAVLEQPPAVVPVTV